ncbi:uncharacterized protein VTP21DRAFT_6458 [Calcarisporiella thermophila]|uniref:uncharacterized protein n=1 Tax=Calcarisporiella thermophila TaxID=911321 RepID=UPI003743ADC5
MSDIESDTLATPHIQTNTQESSHEQVIDEEIIDERGEDGDEEVEEEGEEFEVEKILKHRRSGKTIKYLLKWKGYSDSENTWEDEKNLTGAKDLIEEYWQEHRERNTSASRSGSSRNSRTRTSGVSKNKKKRRLVSGSSLKNQDLWRRSKDWEADVKEVITVEWQPDKKTKEVAPHAYLRWHSGETTCHRIHIAYQRCPQKMIKYFEGRIQIVPISNS